MSAAIVAEVDLALRAAGDPGRAEQERRYLRSAREHAGTGVPAVRAIARSVGPLAHRELVAVVQELWTHPLHEHRVAAVELLTSNLSSLGPTDLGLVERLVRESGTWALVDGLASNVAGGLVERYPELTTTLDRWATDRDFWIRRSALLALLRPLRRGDGDFDRFAAYADAMLDEREFFIRKAIGWVLRDTGRKRPELVYAWLLPRARRASGVTVREAVKYLTEDQRAAVLAARTVRTH